MRAEALDIIIESRGHTVWLRLAGPFHDEQAPNIKEKIINLVSDGNRDIVVDLEGVTFVGPAVPLMFLELINMARGRDASIRFVAHNEIIEQAFSPYRNLFDIYPDVTALQRGWLGARLRHAIRPLFRRTGIRISRPVAVFLLIVLCGWFFTLLYTIHLQSVRIREQAAEIERLTQWELKASMEIESLSVRLKPLEQLGLLPESAENRVP